MVGAVSPLVFAYEQFSAVKNCSNGVSNFFFLFVISDCAEDVYYDEWGWEDGAQPGGRRNSILLHSQQFCGVG